MRLFPIRTHEQQQAWRESREPATRGDILMILVALCLWCVMVYAGCEEIADHVERIDAEHQQYHRQVPADRQGRVG